MKRSPTRETPSGQLPVHYCPGCGHTTLHGLLHEVLDELKLKPRTIGVSTVGCSFLIYDFLDVDFVSSPPGLAPAVATGIKRTHPDRVVFTYQGNQDASGPGAAALLDALARNECISILLVQNATLGLTGGQVASVRVPDEETAGVSHRVGPVEAAPLPITRLAAALGSGARVERAALGTDESVRKARISLRDCFEYPMAGKGLALLEVLSACPTYWNLEPAKAREFLMGPLARSFPPGRLSGDGEGS